MKTIGLIPARINSTRLDRKPLKNIEGYPMFFHVYKRSQMSNLESIYLCTDSKEIYKVAESLGVPSIMTKSSHKNGTERCSEASKILNLKSKDIVVNIHGDEPLVSPKQINKLLIFFESSNYDIVFPHRVINKPQRNNRNMVKIVTNQNNKVLFMSRSLIPSDYRNLKKIKKQCGITIYKYFALKLYSTYKESINERYESIELLRAIDNNFNVGTTLINDEAISVDTYGDLVKVRKLFKNDKLLNSYI